MKHREQARQGEINQAGDTIRIEELELSASVGVPEEERAQPQRVTVSMTLYSATSFGELEDDLLRAVDYGAVCDELQDFVKGRRDRLIETLAHEMADHLLRRFPLTVIKLELRKYILPATRYVAVTVTRSRAAAS